MSFRTWAATFTSHFLNYWDLARHWTPSLKDFLTHKVLAVLKEKRIIMYSPAIAEPIPVTSNSYITFRESNKKLTKKKCIITSNADCFVILLL